MKCQFLWCWNRWNGLTFTLRVNCRQVGGALKFLGLGGVGCGALKFPLHVRSFFFPPAIVVFVLALCREEALFVGTPKSPHRYGVRMVGCEGDEGVNCESRVFSHDSWGCSITPHHPYTAYTKTISPIEQQDPKPRRRCQIMASLSKAEAAVPSATDCGDDVK